MRESNKVAPAGSLSPETATHFATHAYTYILSVYYATELHAGHLTCVFIIPKLGKWIGHLRVPKTLTLKMRPSAQPFLWKWVLIPGMRLKTHFHISGWARNLAFIQRPGGTRKWAINTPLLIFQISGVWQKPRKRIDHCSDGLTYHC